MAGRTRYRRLRRSYTCILLAISAAFFLTRLDAPLLEPEEARYAEIPRQMLTAGHWITPVLHGEPYLHKPPLLYWLNMIAYAIMGVRIEAVRLIAALSGLVVVATVFLLGRRLLGTRPAFLAALVLLATPRFTYWQRMIITDAWLCVWTTVAILTGGLAAISRKGGRGWWPLSIVASGLAILTKGPVALVLIVFPLCVHDVLQRRGYVFALRRWLAYSMLAVAVAAPWFVAVGLAYPGGMWDFFWVHHVVRFTTPIDHAEPFWFYLPHVTLGWLPMSAVWIPMLRDAIRKRFPSAPLLGLPFLAVVTCVGLFSISGCKRPIYILPALPMAALCSGAYLSRAVRWRLLRRLPAAIPIPRYLDRRWAIFANAAILLSTALGYTLAGAVRYVDPLAAGVVAVAAILGLAVVTVARHRWSAEAAWGGCGLSCFAAIWAGIAVLLPAYNGRFGLSADLERVAQLIQARSDATIFCYPSIRDSIPFYLGGRVEKIDDSDIELLRDHVNAGNPAIILLHGNRDDDRLRMRFEACDLPVTEVIRGRKISALAVGDACVVSCR